MLPIPAHGGIHYEASSSIKGMQSDRSLHTIQYITYIAIMTSGCQTHSPNNVMFSEFFLTAMNHQAPKQNPRANRRVGFVMLVGRKDHYNVGSILMDTLWAHTYTQ